MQKRQATRIDKMNKDTIELVNKIKDGGLKPTVQRVDILEYLYNTENFQSAEQIYENLYKDFKVFSKATIYATIEAFVLAGLVRRFYGSRGETRIDRDVDDSAYLICVKCGKVSKVKINEIDVSIDKEGFQVMDRVLTYWGLCENCK